MVIARGSQCGQPGRFSAAPQLSWRIRSWASVIVWETSPQLNASLSSDIILSKLQEIMKDRETLVCCSSWSCKELDTT